MAWHSTWWFVYLSWCCHGWPKASSHGKYCSCLWPHRCCSPLCYSGWSMSQYFGFWPIRNMTRSSRFWRDCPSETASHSPTNFRRRTSSSMQSTARQYKLISCRCCACKTLSCWAKSIRKSTWWSCKSKRSTAPNCADFWIPSRAPAIQAPTLFIDRSILFTRLLCWFMWSF